MLLDRFLWLLHAYILTSMDLMYGTRAARDTQVPPGPSRPPDNPDEPWLCDDCELRIHRCFICKEYGLDEGLTRCNQESCSKFYHRSCLRQWQAKLLE